MPTTRQKNEAAGRNRIIKAPTGMAGLDEITGGGLPQGRPTLVCGGPGCGKTLFAMEFLVRGAAEFGEPGLFVAFEEAIPELIQNAASLGFDLPALVDQKKLALDHVHIDRSEIEEAGEYNLEGLFVRLGYAIDAIGAKRVALDTVEALFGGFSDEAVLRAELQRLFRWLKDKGVTAIITAEQGERTLTRHGLEEYVSDCVILLDLRLQDQISTRRLRIVKYRGSGHGMNEYPFLIDEEGFSIVPITSLGLAHPASRERVSTGIPRLDTMLGGRGLYRGSSTLISGTAGTGKSTLAALVAAASCERGEPCLYFALEESPQQIVRNMASIGLDLEPWVKADLLRFHATRPTLYGLEMHLAVMHKAIRAFKPRLVVVDPITNFVAVGNVTETKALLTRLLDYLKSEEITGIFTSLTEGGDPLEQTAIGVSSLMDTWLLLRHLEANGERNRVLYVLKSRGMAHSNQVREFVMTDRGVDLVDIYAGPAGVLTGTARRAQEAQEIAETLAWQQELERKRREIEQRRRQRDAQIAALEREGEAEDRELERLVAQEEDRRAALTRGREEMARLRGADPAGPDGAHPRHPLREDR
jgi:circadian clock protein KaiC